MPDDTDFSILTKQVIDGLAGIRGGLLSMIRVTAAADATLTALLAAAGGSINASVKRIVLIPASIGVHQNLGAAATVNTPDVLASHPHDITAATAATIHLFAAVATSVDVYQYA